MKSLVTAAVLLFASVAIYAQPAKPCEELKSEIAKKMEAKGVTSYSLEIAATDKAKDTEGKVVGSCDGGSKKIVYRRTTSATATANAAGPKKP